TVSFAVTHAVARHRGSKRGMNMESQVGCFLLGWEIDGDLTMVERNDLPSRVTFPAVFLFHKAVGDGYPASLGLTIFVDDLHIFLEAQPVGDCVLAARMAGPNLDTATLVVYAFQ